MTKDYNFYQFNYLLYISIIFIYIYIYIYLLIRFNELDRLNYLIIIKYLWLTKVM